LGYENPIWGTNSLLDEKLVIGGFVLGRSIDANTKRLFIASWRSRSRITFGRMGCGSDEGMSVQLVECERNFIYLNTGFILHDEH